jgi:hypothetical protein
MKQAVNKRYLAQFDLVPFWVPQVLQDWLEEGWAVDITVKRIKGRHGAKMVRVEIKASTREDLEAKRKAFNAMIEAQGYGPDANKKQRDEQSDKQ